MSNDTYRSTPAFAKSDPFADVRDKRMGELTPEQKDRAYEQWARKQIGHNWPLRDVFEAMFRVIDQLREREHRLGLLLMKMREAWWPFVHSAGSFVSNHARGLLKESTEVLSEDATPVIDMVLYCPNCGTQHIDKDNYDEIRIKAAELGVDREGDRAYSDWLEEHEWTNPPHRSHLCHSCGCIWRPADVFTNGVEAIQTKGKADTWVGKAPFAAPGVASLPAPQAAQAAYAYIYEWDTPFGVHTSTSSNRYNGQPPARSVPVFLAPQAVQTGWKLLKDTTREERSWAEDAAHENGSYFCECMECGRQFIGHKRRVVCKSCAAAPSPDGKAEQAEAPSNELKTLLNTFERQAQRFGELWERCHGKGWPEKESDEFHSLRDDRMPKTRAALLKALATQPTASNAGEREDLLKRADRALLIAEGALTQVSPCMAEECHQDQTEIMRIAEKECAEVRALLRAALASKPPAGERKPVVSVAVEGGRMRGAVRREGLASLPDGDHDLYAAPQPEQVAQDSRPTEPGLYAWVPEHGSPSLVLVGKRPTAHCDGGILNGQVLDSSKFYDGCAMTSWPADGWVNLRAARTRGEGGGA